MENNTEIVHEVIGTRKSKKGLTQKLCALGLAALISITTTTPALAASKTYPDVLINDAKVTYSMKETPYYSESEGCTYLPLSTLNVYGYKTYYYNNEIHCGCEYGTLVFTPTDKVFTFNGKKYEMPGTVKMVEGVPYVPVVVVATAINAKTEWNNETYRINFITNEKKVDEQRLDKIYFRINNNSDLTYQEKQTVKSFAKEYVDFIDPTLDEVEDICNALTKLDIKTSYLGTSKPIYSIDNGVITYNSSRSGVSSKDDALRNALCSMFNKTSCPLFYGVDEIVSAEMKKVNTNQNHAMVIVSKMLKEIIGKDKLLEAYRNNNMKVIKNELMSIYNDEALYNNLEDLIQRIYSFDNADFNGQTLYRLSKSKQEKMYKEDCMNLYGILDVYYQCKYGYEIIDDDIMEAFYAELLAHGKMKSFKYEERVFIEDNNKDYTVIYRTPQTGYNRYASSYNYYESYRPTKYSGNGQLLELN